jgi:sporulation protein YlmC with PRC-barrel domain
MTPNSRIKLVSELLDLPLVDSEGQFCGIVDDVELSGGPGKELELKALLVGPGAYQGRIPAWAFWFVERLARNRLTQVPMEKIRTIHTAVHLKCPGRDLGLHKSETAAGRWIPKKGAL